MDYKLSEFETHDDARGKLVVFLKEPELTDDYKRFGQIYFITFSDVGIIRGNHYHKFWREWFGIVHGKVEVVLKRFGRRRARRSHSMHQVKVTCAWKQDRTWLTRSGV